MKTSLSDLLSDSVIQDLRVKIKNHEFPKIDFESAMLFILNNGILPKSDLPAESFLKLEDWLRKDSKKVIRLTATELKNKTGEILDKVIKGNIIQILKHGRVVAEIKGVD